MPQKRPKHFASLQDAVDWAMDTGGAKLRQVASLLLLLPSCLAPQPLVKSYRLRITRAISAHIYHPPFPGMCKRQEAAHVSLPSMLRQMGTGEGAAVAAAGLGQPLSAGGLEPLAEEEDGDEEGAADVQDAGQPPQPTAPQHLPPRPPRPEAGVTGPVLGGSSSGGGGGVGGSSGSSSSGGPGWVWRTQLEQSAPYWEGWYSGLSDMFLGLRVPKVGSVRCEWVVRAGCSAPCRA